MREYQRNATAMIGAAPKSVSGHRAEIEMLRINAISCAWKFSLVFLLLTGVLPFARAVIFYSTGGLNYNTTAPSGSLAGSGWQWVGSWIGFQAVPIGPFHFLAAHHIGGAVGDVFVLNGISYTTTAFFDDPASDLRIWQVSAAFSSWAPLYRTGDEVGRGLVVFGRGLTRGGAISVNGALKGWYWGASDGRLRWGQNTVATTFNGGSYWGELLYATFDQTGGVNEADLASGDSSGPVFINDGTGWKLAGVAATVDSYFNTTNSGSGFIAALFDASGLYYSPTNGSPWSLIPGPGPVPSGFYATQVSVRAAWIDSIVAPVPDDVPLLSGPQMAVFLAALAGGGAFFLRRAKTAPS